MILDSFTESYPLLCAAYQHLSGLRTEMRWDEMRWNADVFNCTRQKCTSVPCILFTRPNESLPRMNPIFLFLIRFALNPCVLECLFTISVATSFFSMLACRSISGFFVLDSFYMNMNVCFGSLLCTLPYWLWNKYFHVCCAPVEKRMELKAKILFF